MKEICFRKIAPRGSRYKKNKRGQRMEPCGIPPRKGHRGGRKIINRNKETSFSKIRPKPIAPAYKQGSHGLWCRKQMVNPKTQAVQSHPSQILRV